MKISSILNEMDKGHKIRRREWNELIFLMKVDGEIKSFMHQTTEFHITNDIFSSNEWIDMDEPDINLNFIDAIQCAFHGHKISKTSWNKDKYLLTSSNKKELLLHDIISREFSPTFECLTSDDWEVI